MGTIIARTRKDGSTAFTAQIVIKKAGAIVHRESQSFDRRQAATAWIVKREEQLKKPGGLEKKEDPTLSAVIDRYIAVSKNIVLGTKAQVLKTIKNSDLGEIKCSDLTSHTLVSFAKRLTQNIEPQTCANYFSHLSNIFTVARPAWGYPLSRQEFDDAVTVLKNQDVKTGKNQNSPPQVKSRGDFYDWLAKTIKINGIHKVDRDTAFDDKYLRSAGIRLSYTSHERP